MHAHRIVAFGLLGVSLAGSALAVTATLEPTARAWAGFVDNQGNRDTAHIGTGSLQFALFGTDARGFAKFPLTTIPAGATIRTVRLKAYICNHDLSTVPGPVCAKTVSVGRAAADPQAATTAQLFAAIGTGCQTPARYATWLQARTGVLYCGDTYIPIDTDLGPQAVADVQAALPAGWFTIGLRSDVPCQPNSDHLDWFAYPETITGVDPGCTVSTVAGSRIKLVVTYDVTVMSVEWDTYDATEVLASGVRAVEVTFKTLEESDTNYFVVERADSVNGDYVALPGIVDARGPGFPYRLVDATGGVGHWYRVVEYTSQGRGDVTPAFPAHATGSDTRTSPSGARSRTQRTP